MLLEQTSPQPRNTGGLNRNVLGAEKFTGSSAKIPLAKLSEIISSLISAEPMMHQVGGITSPAPGSIGCSYPEDKTFLPAPSQSCCFSGINSSKCVTLGQVKFLTDTCRQCLMQEVLLAWTSKQQPCLFSPDCFSTFTAEKWTVFSVLQGKKKIKLSVLL